MNKTEFRKLIREEIQHVVYEQQLTEGKLTDFFSKIKDAATKVAKDNYQDAMQHVDTNKLESKPLPTGILNKAQKELETKSQSIEEGFIDSIKKISAKGTLAGMYGSIGSGLLAASAGLSYLDATFNKWYYQYIQGMAESEVMKVMTDLYGAKAAEGSIWFKLGMYAFFVFFTIAVLSYITLRITSKIKK